MTRVTTNLYAVYYILLLLCTTWLLFIESAQAGLGPPVPPKKPTEAPAGPPSDDPPPDAPTPSDPGGGEVDIQFVFLEEVTSEVASLFESAKARWSSVFSDNFGGSITMDEGFDVCGLFKTPEEAEIEDIVIFVLVTKIDGPGEYVGQAGPCGVDENGLVRVGAFIIDVEDLDEIVEQGYGEITVVHQVGHIFGFGLFWEELNLVGEPTDPDHELEDYKLRYLGEEGNIGNEEVGLQFEAIVEDSGEEGVLGIHWEEDIYQDELMTAFFPTTSEIILSKLTIRSLADLGYPVDPEAADDFEVDSEIVDDLDFGSAKAGKAPKNNLRGSKAKNKKPRRSYGNDVLRKPITVLKSKKPK